MWELHPSDWAVGTLAIRYDEFDGVGEGPSVTCYAPPGTSVYGESGLAVARWRRASWSHEAFMVAREAPDRLEAIAVRTVCQEVMPELLDWVEQETAAHVDRLRAFAHRRPRTGGVAEAADDLLGELEEARPDALDRYCLEEDAAALQADAAELTPPTPRRDVIALRLMRPNDWILLAWQVAVLAVIYLGYRVVRPADVTGQVNPSVLRLLTLPLREVLLWLYGQLHVVLTVAFLAWVYFRRNSAFSFIRNALVLAALLALSIYTAASLSHYATLVWPRPGEWVPTLAVPTTPALHLAVAGIMGFAGVRLFRPASLRLASALYPVAVIGVVAATRPRWLLVTLAGALLASVAGWLAAALVGRRVATWRKPPTLAVRPHGKLRGRYETVSTPIAR